MMFFSPLCPPPSRCGGCAASLGQGHVVGDHQHPLRGDLVEPGRLAHRLPGQVHVGGGLHQQHRLPPITVVLVRALYLSFWTGMLARSASSSTTRNPTLCRVHSYLGPGLPSPHHQPFHRTGLLERKHMPTIPRLLRYTKEFRRLPAAESMDLPGIPQPGLAAFPRPQAGKENSMHFSTGSAGGKYFSAASVPARARSGCKPLTGRAQRSGSPCSYTKSRETESS